ncbi:hypothetical protein H5410_034943 [Solanum commersonii]|uniref:Knottins-like domain-containing protein n=1 Tax=Solanum commersonii TaxID=4109 RepID=A0A9J5Y1H6_SOLCO|nr:hypothetical protein H5410_034943 [Solanum commersonii]
MSESQVCFSKFLLILFSVLIVSNVYEKTLGSILTLSEKVIFLLWVPILGCQKLSSTYSGQCYDDALCATKCFTEGYSNGVCDWGGLLLGFACYCQYSCNKI